MNIKNFVVFKRDSYLKVHMLASRGCCRPAAAQIKSDEQVPAAFVVVAVSEIFSQTHLCEHVATAGSDMLPVRDGVM